METLGLFLYMITLSEEQSKALNHIEDWILHGKTYACTLSGSAGTGKSTIIRMIIDFLQHKAIKYCLTAPTHKAALVLESLTDQKVMTLHSLLALSPKLDILELDFKELEFNSNPTKNVPYHGVIICDEASMINDELFKFIEEKCEEHEAKVLYVGDRMQLSPVGKFCYSKVWDINNSVTLTKIFRQDNESALTPLLVKLRKHYLTNFNLDIREKGSTFVIANANEYLNKIIEAFKYAINKSDILYTKILAYTNDRVRIYNELVHKSIFGKENQYNKFEFLTAYDNFEYNMISYENGMDYIIINEPVKTSIFIPEVGNLPGYELELYNSLTKESGIVNILDKEISSEYTNWLCDRIEHFRIKAITTKDKQRRGFYWKKYFQIMNSFVTPFDLYYGNRLIRKKSLDYGYAVTVHKSQGSSITNIFVDMKDLFKRRDAEELRQLQYVALSRARKDAYIYL